MTDTDRGLIPRYSMKEAILHKKEIAFYREDSIKKAKEWTKKQHLLSLKK